jgi:cell division protein FtsB
MSKMDQFDQLAQEIFKQKQLMDRLEAENRELRRQLAELRAGRGIYVDVSRSRFSLRDGSSPRDSFIGTR